MNPRDVTLTREQIYDWYQEAVVGELVVEDHVRTQLEGLFTVGDSVTIAQEDHAIIDRVIDDLSSYAPIAT